MMRTIGAALVLVASTGLGFRVARAYRDRPKQLGQLMESIRMLRAEIEYNLTPLPEALTRVADKSATPFRQTFVMAAERVTDGHAVVDAFAAGIKAIRGQSALLREDYTPLEDFARTLGTSDLSHQRQQLDSCLERLTSLRDEAALLQRKNERLWQFLGVLFGLFVVVVLY